jgi:hypothetical protein
MRCEMCFEFKKKGTRCVICRKRICFGCLLSFHSEAYCKECYSEKFQKELIFDLAEVFGIKDNPNKNIEGKKISDVMIQEGIKNENIL